MRTFAKGTVVSAHRSVEQIERLLLQNGAQDISTGSRPEMFAVIFSREDRRYRFTVPLPAEHAFKAARSASQRSKLRNQAVREKYRALYATIKTKLISAQAGIETFEDAFLAQAVTATGETVTEWLQSSGFGFQRASLMAQNTMTLL